MDPVGLVRVDSFPPHALDPGHDVIAVSPARAGMDLGSSGGGADAVSPARAGMDLLIQSVPRFPRTRGDPSEWW